LKLENTARELQIHSLDPGAWVEPRDILEMFSPTMDPDPAKGSWVEWQKKMLPLIRNADGEVFLQVNAADGIRKWTLSDCRSELAWMDMGKGPSPESRPTVGDRLDEVKDYILDWPGDAGRHPHLYLKRPELEALWKRPVAEPSLLEYLVKCGGGSMVRQGRPMLDLAYQQALGAYLLTGSSEVAAKTQLLERLRKALKIDLKDLLFNFGMVCSLYDALIDDALIPETERSFLRAQFACLGYGIADPTTWSAERGYCSGNQNMTVNFVLGLGMVACTIPEHPMAKTWNQKAQRMMEYFLTQMVSEGGEWPEAMGHHGMISVAAMLAYGIASTNVGFHDYVNDPRMKRLMLYQAKIHTPRDPRPRGNVYAPAPDLNRRYIPSMGRDDYSADQDWALSGMMARATRTSDPEYSAALQWLWLESGTACWSSGSKLGGFEYVYCDKSLPSKVPSWPSEVFPRAGVVMRHGLNTADEHQVMLYSGDHDAAFYPSHSGCFPSIFAYGKPVGGSFAGGYEYQERFLTCHVDLAQTLGTLEERTACFGHFGSAKTANPWGWPDEPTARFGERGGLANVSAFSTLSRQDYTAVDVALHYPRKTILPWLSLPEWPPVTGKVNGKPPVDWRRQVLFLKGEDPGKTTYFLIRDSIKGGQPTMWQMWTLTDKIGTPEEVKNLDAFLKDKPGDTICPSRELKGDRFTAVGQLGVDVEYYLASPTNTQRHTLRWGTEWFYRKSNLKLKSPEYQDLLHLQMPGDGVYYVAFFPRKRADPAPTFQKLGDGTIIKVSGDFGTDYGFLSAQETTGAGEGVSFRGIAASVQARKSGLVLALGAKGEVRYLKHGLAADFPVSLQVQKNELTVEFPEGIQPPAFQLMKPFPGGTVTITAPGGKWKLAEPLPGVKLVKSGSDWVLEVPAGLKAVKLAQGN
jgi:hypothetical protein